MKVLVVALLVLALVVTGGQLAAAAPSCESLLSLSLPNTMVTFAQAVPAAGLKLPASAGLRDEVATLPGFCRVAATLRPSPDSDIKIEVWMPASDWNGNFQGVGNGGWGGSISYPAMAVALAQGYATASTDTGHNTEGGSFALDHPEKLVDFGSRAVHDMTVAAKALAAAYYSSSPRLSYWTGCSGGGRQALMEAQRFPADYDGIVAGAPSAFFIGRSAQAVWVAQAMHKDPASHIPPSKYPAIHSAVLQACDALDGVKDGVLENPARCRFDPKVMECPGPDGPGCLTTPQVEAARKVYAASMNPRTKEELFTPLYPGSEMGWGTWGGPQPFGIALDYFKYVLFKDPAWDYRTLNFDSDIARATQMDNGTVNALNPNLKAFFDRGGKMIQYHGWADPQISPGNSVQYYKTVLDAAGGASKVQSAYRLFMVPGMAHCRGGDGTSSFDMLGAMEQWVEKGQAPNRIVAARARGGHVDRTRPLCPYPQTAQYKDAGSTDDAANFVCAAP
jgi:Tannase and feruloyl esterase